MSKAENFHAAYVDAFNSGNPDAVVALYEPDAALLPPQADPLIGHAAIREGVKQFQAAGRMTAETRYCITVGDLALASAAWQISGTGPDGKPAQLAGASADLLRRQPDGQWLLVVDHPVGGM